MIHHSSFVASIKTLHINRSEIVPSLDKKTCLKRLNKATWVFREGFKPTKDTTNNNGYHLSKKEVGKEKTTMSGHHIKDLEMSMGG